MKKSAEKPKTRVCAYKRCPRKGEPFEINTRGRPRKYCTFECQQAQWHDLHPVLDLTAQSGGLT